MEKKLFNTSTQRDKGSLMPTPSSRYGRDSKAINIDTPKEKVASIIASSMMEVVNRKLEVVKN